MDTNPLASQQGFVTSSKNPLNTPRILTDHFLVWQLSGKPQGPDGIVFEKRQATPMGAVSPCHFYPAQGNPRTVASC
jgi:hypothetical protein